MQNKKNLLLIIAISFIYIPYSSFAVELKTAAQNSSPKYYRSGNVMTGLCVEIIQAIEKADPYIKISGYQVFIPFKRLQYQLKTGELDFFVGLRSTEKRRREFKFLNTPLYRLNYVIAARADDNIMINSFNDIRSLNKNAQILTVRGSATNSYLKKYVNSHIHGGADSPSKLLKMLIHKRARFAFYHDLGLNYIIHRYGYMDKIRIIPKTFLTYFHYIAFSRNVPDETINRVQKAVIEIKRNGKLKKIRKKYYLN